MSGPPNTELPTYSAPEFLNAQHHPAGTGSVSDELLRRVLEVDASLLVQAAKMSACAFTPNEVDPRRWVLIDPEPDSAYRQSSRWRVWAVCGRMEMKLYLLGDTDAAELDRAFSTLQGFGVLTAALAET